MGQVWPGSIERKRSNSWAYFEYFAIEARPKMAQRWDAKTGSYSELLTRIGPLIGSIEQMLESIESLSLGDEERRKVLGGNTARLLGLE